MYKSFMKCNLKIFRKHTLSVLPEVLFLCYVRAQNLQSIKFMAVIITAINLRNYFFSYMVAKLKKSKEVIELEFKNCIAICTTIGELKGCLCHSHKPQGTINEP